MFDKIKNLLLKKNVSQPEVQIKEPKKKPVKKELSEKEKATLNNEPYIAITKVEINPENINDGSFELDYNDKFVLNLVRAGYKFREDDTDQIIVDRWFQNTCRNIALEIYAQIEADPTNRDTTIRPIQTRNLGNGRTEVS